eukprot:332958_1
MHYKANNMGETYTWFIALGVATMNIITELPVPMETIMTVCVLMLFFPIIPLAKGFIQEKAPWDFKWETTNPEDAEPEKLQTAIHNAEAKSIDKANDQAEPLRA